MYKTIRHKRFKTKRKLRMCFSQIPVNELHTEDILHALWKHDNLKNHLPFDKKYRCKNKDHQVMQSDFGTFCLPKSHTQVFCTAEPHNCRGNKK